MSTNAQIAERLVVSPHNVERHVENILDRLRLSSRVEIAVWMTRPAGAVRTRPAQARRRRHLSRWVWHWRHV